MAFQQNSKYVYLSALKSNQLETKKMCDKYIPEKKKMSAESAMWKEFHYFDIISVLTKCI